MASSTSTSIHFNRWCLFCLNKEEFNNENLPSSFSSPSSRTFSNFPPNMSALCKFLKIDWQQQDDEHEHDEQFLLCCNCSGVLEVLLDLHKNLEELQRAIEEKTLKIRSFIVETGVDGAAEEVNDKKSLDVRRKEDLRIIWKFHKLVRQAAEESPQVEEMRKMEVDPKLPGGSMVAIVRLTRIMHKDDLLEPFTNVKAEPEDDKLMDDDWSQFAELDVDDEDEGDAGGIAKGHENPLGMDSSSDPPGVTKGSTGSSKQEQVAKHPPDSEISSGFLTLFKKLSKDKTESSGKDKDLMNIKISSRGGSKTKRSAGMASPVRKRKISKGTTKRGCSTSEVTLESDSPDPNSNSDANNSTSAAPEPGANNPNAVQCPFCKKFSKNATQLTRHIRHAHDEKVDQSSKLSEFVKPEESQTCCSICGKSFVATQSTTATYTKHMLSHTDEEISHSLGIPTSYRISSKSGKRIGTRTCTLCGKTTTHDGLPGFREHMLSHEPLEIPAPGDSSTTTTFPCSICDKRFVHSLNLELHKLYSHSLRRRPAFKFKCDRCGLNRKSREALIVHLKSHDDGGSVYSCKSCPMSYSSLNRLLHHMIKHAFSGRFPCPVCDDVVASSLKQLEDHCVSHHAHEASRDECSRGKQCPKPTRHKKPAGEVLSCEICLKSFRSKFSLECHLQLHSDPNTWKCEPCGKSYSSKVALATHVAQVHEGIRYQCPHCVKTFSRRNLLDDHLGEHSGVKPHACHVCGKQFGASRPLQMHLKVVHAEAPAVCEVCGLECRNLIKLRRHFTTVHGEKRFSCEQCPKAFSKKWNLRAHLLTHMGGQRPFPCHLCDKGFVRRDYLQEHLAKVHHDGGVELRDGLK